MYIKQVVIDGFKSYREQIATEACSPKVNCVVGANESGKSNFFHAIRFVISDLFHNCETMKGRHCFMKGRAIRSYLHLWRSCLTTLTTAFQKTEVMNLLESAGFSRSNPYYVVQQGKIASLTLMKDSDY